MGRDIGSSQHGESLVQWHAARAKQGTQSTPDAEQIVDEARASGCVVARKVDGEFIEVLAREPFDPGAEEYRVFDPHIDK